jgi:predicted GNAT family N-acyltransferase
MIGLIYWTIITFIYIIGVVVVHNQHRKYERSQQLLIEVLKCAIRDMGGEITEEQGQLTIQYHERGEDE